MTVCNLETVMAPHSTSQHVSYKLYLSIPKIEHNTFTLFILPYCSAVFINNVKWREFWETYETAITQDWLTVSSREFCVLKKDGSFKACLFGGQNSFRSGRNTAAQRCRRAIGLDPCEAYCFKLSHRGFDAFFCDCNNSVCKTDQRRHFQAVVFRTQLKNKWSECDLEEERLQETTLLSPMLIYSNEKRKLESETLTMAK